jgi:hypothetical protein
MDYLNSNNINDNEQGEGIWGFGDSALGEGMPDRTQRYPVFVWGLSEPTVDLRCAWFD